MNILECDYKVFPRAAFDFIWSSPVCTEYIKAKTVGTRDLEGADKLVSKTLEVIAYFRTANWSFENPQTGLLKTRDIVKGLPYYDTSYCRYGYSYRKATRVWSSLVPWLHSPCSLQDPCSAVIKKLLNNRDEVLITITPTMCAHNGSFVAFSRCSATKSRKLLTTKQ